jgi:voltage-gated potassium channel
MGSSGPPPHRDQLRRSLLRSIVLVAVLLGAFALLPFRGELWWVGAAVGAGLLVTTMPFAVTRVRRVLASELPLFEAFESLVQLLAMLVVGFAAVYYAMNRDGTQLDGIGTRVDAVYFTVSTLSTVGFGDITPTTQVARVVVTAQVMFDFVFLGVAFRVFAKAASR